MYSHIFFTKVHKSVIVNVCVLLYNILVFKIQASNDTSADDLDVM